MTVDHRRYCLPPHMGWDGLISTYEEIFQPDHPHYYEYQNCAIRPGDVVIDAGASEGFFTEFALQRGARVITVEPSQVYVDCLTRTFEREIAENRVSVVRGLLDHQDGETTISIHACGWASSPGAEDTVSSEIVPKYTLDSLLDLSPWGRIDFVKMDIEGAELTVLSAGHKLIGRCRPRFSVAVYHNPTGYFRVKRSLQAAGVPYQVRAKGVYRLAGMPIPKMLHAWPVQV